MCGFCGFTGELIKSDEVLTNMMNKIIHRGPDSEGKHIDHDVALGFRRLSIIDLDNGSQPMYNENNDQNESKEINPEMDKLDTDILNYATKNKIPVMGICRGHQAMSACFGKALYQDIESNHLEHPHDGIYHEVTKVNNFGLGKELPDKFITNTYHHQATKDLPDGFVVLYKNHEVIEAIEHETLPIIATQWHPERMDTKESDIIFNYFKKLIMNNSK